MPVFLSISFQPSKMWPSPALSSTHSQLLMGKDNAQSQSLIGTNLINRAMNWDSWPFTTQPDGPVPTGLDTTLQTAAKAAEKTFLMGVSPLQFKHLIINGVPQNWYRRGEQNLEVRFGQVLSIQPDFIELQTWNDAGESHYMGNSWPEPKSSTDIPGYTTDYDHTGFWQILPAFIKAFKAGATTTASMFPTNGAAVQGTFWHHTLTAAGVNYCSLSNLKHLLIVLDLSIGFSRTSSRCQHR
jgi:hypothetical protein